MRKLALLLLYASSVFGATTPAAEFAARRARLAAEVGPNAIVFVFSARPANRNGDVDYPFRQSDSILYLTGIEEPDTTLVLLPDEPKEILFTRDRNPRAEQWSGKIPSREEVSAISGVKTVESSGRAAGFLAAAVEGSPLSLGNAPPASYQPPAFPAFLRAVREGRAEVWVPFPSRWRDDPASAEQKFAAEVARRFPDVKIRDLTPLLRAMRVVKSPAEIALLERAIRITDAAQKAGMKRALTAEHEYQVQATIEHTFRDQGACCWGFPSIVAAGANATILHYVRNDAPIPRNGLLLADIGAEVEGYTADVTRTYPVSGKFTEGQRAIYEAVLKAQEASIALMRPGHTFREMNDKAVEVLGAELLRLGLVSKNDPRQVRWYLPHSVAHQIGLDVHDVVEPGTPFLANMVVTNEPGIYVRPDDVTGSETFRALPAAEQESIRGALDRYRDIGVRIEDCLLVTEGAPRLLSTNSPRTVADIERFLASR